MILQSYLKPINFSASWIGFASQRKGCATSARTPSPWKSVIPKIYVESLLKKEIWSKQLLNSSKLELELIIKSPKLLISLSYVKILPGNFFDCSTELNHRFHCCYKCHPSWQQLLWFHFLSYFIKLRKDVYFSIT